MAIDLEKILSQTEQELIKRLNVFDFDLFFSLSEVEQQQLLAQIELFGYDKLLNEIESDNIAKLRQLQKLAEGKSIIIDVGNQERYRRLIEINKFQARKASEYHLSQVFSAAIYGNINGLNTKEIIARIPEDNPLSKNQLVAEIDATVGKYNATVTAEIFDDPEQKFELVGADDTRTRPECRAILTYQPKGGWTKAEIDGGIATKMAKTHYHEFTKYTKKDEDLEYTWLNRGGYNCRHNWQAL